MHIVSRENPHTVEKKEKIYIQLYLAAKIIVISSVFLQKSLHRKFKA